MNWQELSSTSHYQTAVAVEHELQGGNIREATVGMKELIDALARSEKRALKSQLIRLMVHVIKSKTLGTEWKSQPERQSRSWAATIYNAREEIADIQVEDSRNGEEIPSLTHSVILEMWDKSFRAAKREAEGEMNQSSPVLELSWQEVFEDPYGEK